MPATHHPRTPAWPPKSAPRLFVPDKLAESVEIRLEGNHAHYLAKVMRAAEGDPVILCDNATGEWLAAVSATGKRDVVLTVERQLRRREAAPDITLVVALLKKDRFDMMLEKATELGAARIQPVLTRRCVADRLNRERAMATITEAAEQCARTALPDLAEPVKLDALLKDWLADRALFFADENGGDPAAAAFAASPGPAALLVGPEGGFDDAERAAVRSHPQAHPISLGPRVLRGETAAIAALAVWMSVAGDWNK
ncbi:MAG: 16S rRNA (uracil(1498)-N(3))-methyltransferase [Alphaproteobacteria bacterium]|nr:16S rRNA (uracil(1498)-N(3))-methyltransferase [Alphaproteobacteria bacterium]